MLFAEDGHTVHQAEDADEAIELLGLNEYDLLVAEPRAYLRDGRSFADVLHADWPELTARSLMLTADVRPETDRWLRSLGCRYAKKPISANDLRATVADLLTGDPDPE